LQFHKGSQYFFGANHETLSVALRVDNPALHPSKSIADTQPQLHPAFNSVADIFQ